MPAGVAKLAELEAAVPAGVAKLAELDAALPAGVATEEHLSLNKC